MFFVALGLGYPLGIWPLERCVFGVAPLAWGIAASLPMLAAFLGMNHSNWAPFARIQDDIAPFTRDYLSQCGVLSLALIAALAGLGEEVLFRGLIQTALVGKVGVVLAVAITSVAFGLCHALSWPYAIFATLIGVYFGVLFEFGGNLAIPILAHGFYDFVALVYLVRQPKPNRQPAPQNTERDASH